MPTKKLQKQKQKEAVIIRIFERGNDIEKEEMKRFYKSAIVKNTLEKSIRKPYTIYTNKENE